MSWFSTRTAGNLCQLTVTAGYGVTYGKSLRQLKIVRRALRTNVRLDSLMLSKHETLLGVKSKPGKHYENKI